MKMFFNLPCKCFLLSQCVLKQTKSIIRTTSNLPVHNKLLGKPILINKSPFKIVYDFPYIKFPAAFIKSRITIPVLCVFGSCYIYVAHESLATAFLIGFSGCIHGLTASLVSFFGRDMVGKIYVNKEGDINDVLFSSIDKHGNRIDRVHNINEIINCDHPNKIASTFGFVRIGFENSTLNYLVNTKTCKLVDPLICDFILGGYWGFDSKKIDEKRLLDAKEKS